MCLVRCVTYVPGLYPVFEPAWVPAPRVSHQEDFFISTLCIETGYDFLRQVSQRGALLEKADNDFQKDLCKKL